MKAFVTAASARLAQVELNPDPDAGPGGRVLETIVNWIGGIALIVCLAALVVGAAFWAVGANSNNHSYAVNGKKAVMVAGAAALVIGAAAALINFLYGLGGQV